MDQQFAITSSVSSSSSFNKILIDLAALNFIMMIEEIPVLRYN